MTERGMIFNSEMVRAILDGRKTQTRRPIKWKQTRFTEIGERDDGSKWPWSEDAEHACDFWHPCPFGAVGDRIWIRESFFPAPLEMQYTPPRKTMWNIAYRDGVQMEKLAPAEYNPLIYNYERWTPSIHMPRWASRILLEITDVRVERLNAISEEDARAEGIIDGGCLNCGEPEPCGCANPEPDATDAFPTYGNRSTGRKAVMLTPGFG